MATILRLRVQCRTARARCRLAYCLQVPWRKDLCSRRRGQIPVLRPGTTNDRESDTGISLECLPVRNLLKLVKAWRIGGSRSEVMDENAVAASLQLLRQEKPGCFFGDVCIGLVCNAENRDHVARPGHFIDSLDQL